MMSLYPSKYMFLLLGWVSLGLGVIGILLPLLPTTPFVILAAYFFNRGSDKIHLWLLNTKYFGLMIKDWEQSKVIRLKAKIFATATIIPLFAYSLIFVKVFIWIKVIVALIGLGVLIFIWSRPSKKLSKHRIPRPSRIEHTK